MNIYEILQREHVAIVRLIGKAQNADGEERDELVDELLDALTAHAAAEEDVFYDRLADSKGVAAAVGEAREEHVDIARALHDLQRALPDDVDEKLETLSSLLEHHIDEEEEELFLEAERVFDDDVAVALGGQYLVRKAEVEEIPVEDRIADALARGGVDEEDVDTVKIKKHPSHPAPSR